MNIEYIKEFFKNVLFDERNHTYSIGNNTASISVSGLVKKFVRPFNGNVIATYIAIRDGKNKEELLKQWEDIGKKACVQGTETHSFAESYFNNNATTPLNCYQQAVVSFFEDLPEFIKPVISELKMFHKEFCFAGTCDILLYNEKNNKYILGDFKTNKDIFKNYNGQTMLKPFSHLLDTPYNQYQLQLSFYQILLEQINVDVYKRKIIWLLPDGNYNMYDTEDYTKELNMELVEMFYNNENWYNKNR